MKKGKWKREDITPEVLRQLLRLDKETGKLYWRERGPEWFPPQKTRWGNFIDPEVLSRQFNKNVAGQEAFTVQSPDGLTGKVLQVGFRRNIVVYAIVHGRFPEVSASFSDGNIYNVSPENVIDMDHSLRRHRADQSFRRKHFRGVSWKKERKGSVLVKNYYATLEGRHLGVYSTPIEAARAYDKASFDKWGKDARLNFPEDYGLSKPEAEMPENYYDDELK